MYPASHDRALLRCSSAVGVSIATLLLTAPAFAWDVGAAPSTSKILPSTAMPQATAIELFAARNEWEAIQIIVRDDAGATGVDVDLSDLCNGTDCISASEARLYREHFVNVVNASSGNIEYHEREKGLYPDPLIPFDDPYSDSHAPAGAPFDLAAGETGVVFVDWHVPSTAAPGRYTGTATVHSASGSSSEISLSLTVWDFEIPVQPTIPTAFRYPQEKNIRKFHGGPEDGSTPERVEITDRYFRVLHEHRIDPTTVNGPIDFTFDATGNLQPVDWTAYDQEVAPWLDGTKFGDGIRVTRFDVDRFSPGSGTGEWTQSQYAQAAQAFAEHLEEKGWWERAYVYATDEPWLNDPQTTFPAIEQDADTLFSASELWRGHVLVTGPFDERIAGKVGIWCPVTPMYEDWDALWGAMPGREVYDERRALGEDLWFYVCNANLPPYAGYDIDTAIGYEPRIVKWGAWYEHATGFLYWRTCYWVDDDPWNVLLNIPQFSSIGARNGDGLLLFPGNHDGTAGGKGSPEWLAVDGPIPSYRLKQVRDGLEDWEMFKLATSLGAEDYAREQVSRAYTKFGTFFAEGCEMNGRYCPEDQPWTLDEAVLADVRKNIAAKIQYLEHPERYADPEALPEPESTLAGGCGCRAQTGTTNVSTWALFLAALLGVRRRTQRR